MKTATSYAITRAASDYQYVEDRHIVFALTNGWSEKRARREFAAFERRREARDPQRDFTRGAADPRVAKIRRLGKGCPDWIVQRAIQENWSISTAAAVFLKVMRTGKA